MSEGISLHRENVTKSTKYSPKWLWHKEEGSPKKAERRNHKGTKAQRKRESQSSRVF
jgi:hypothetical protein